MVENSMLVLKYSSILEIFMKRYKYSFVLENIYENG